MPEAKVEQCLRVDLLPNGSGVSRTINTAPQFSNDILSKSELGREADVDRALRPAVKICFPDVKKVKF